MVAQGAPHSGRHPGGAVSGTGATPRHKSVAKRSRKRDNAKNKALKGTHAKRYGNSSSNSQTRLTSRQTLPPEGAWLWAYPARLVPLPPELLPGPGPESGSTLAPGADPRSLLVVDGGRS